MSYTSKINGGGVWIRTKNLRKWLPLVTNYYTPGQNWTCTNDPRFFRPILYWLSYLIEFYCSGRNRTFILGIKIQSLTTKRHLRPCPESNRELVCAKYLFSPIKLHGHNLVSTGIEPVFSEWKSEVLPLDEEMEGEGIEPSKLKTTDLQSASFGRLDTLTISCLCEYYNYHKNYGFYKKLT